MIYLLASLQIRHDPSVHADPGRIFLHLQKQMSYLWVSTAHNRSYQDATTITKAERINIAFYSLDFWLYHAGCRKSRVVDDLFTNVIDVSLLSLEMSVKGTGGGKMR